MHVHVVSFDGSRWTQQPMDMADAYEQVKKDKLTWIRAGGLSAAGLEGLGQQFGLHPLTLEDVQNERQRPKVEAYADLTFAMLRVPRAGDTWQSIGLFLGTDFLITASTHPLPELDVLMDRLLRKGLPQDRSGVDGLFYMAVDGLVDAWFPFLDHLEEDIEHIEDEVHDRAHGETLANIRQIKRTCSKTRKVSGPMREAILALERAPHPNIEADARLYLRDVSDHMIRITERLQHVQEMALIAQEGWNATLANSQNQQMKRLTVVFALFLVPTFLAGLGGMNFGGFPDWPYWPVTGTILGMVGIGFLVSYWKGWL